MEFARTAVRRSRVAWRVADAERRSGTTQTQQVHLASHYRDLAGRGGTLPDLGDAEFKTYSQNGEDGILLLLFAVLGTTQRTCVEVCAGDGIECNTANLIVNHGWRGLLVDGDAANVERATRFYTRTRNAQWFTPVIVEAWVTAEGVNDLIARHGFTGEIDLLSLDLDGNDYWIWEALTCVDPRVVVAEFNWLWGPTEAQTMPYDPKHAAPAWTREGGLNQHMGASLTAMTKLAQRKGYRLIGCQRSGFNAFFVRDDVGAGLFPAIEPERCFETVSLRTGWQPTMLDELRRFDWTPV